MLRKQGVVGKFVEFYGAGLARLPLADRATIGNMSPGVRRDLRDLPDRRRDAALPARSPAARRSRSRSSRPTRKEQGLWHDERRRGADVHATRSSSTSATSSRRSPARKRPQDRVPLTDAQERVPRGARGLRARARRRTTRRSRTASRRATRRPRQGPAHGAPQHAPNARRDAGRRATRRTRGAGHARRRHRDRARPRLRRDRRDHELHEHVEPVGDARRRPARAQRASRAA